MLFSTEKMENSASKRFRRLMSLYPVYFFTGGRIKFVSADWKEVHISLSLSWYTKNYVGTIYGGSIYSAADPLYMIMLIRILGDKYVVWDKAGIVKFVRPGKGTIKARFLITEETLTQIREAVSKNNEMDIDLKTEFVNDEGKVVAEVIKTIYVADKEHYNQKRKSKGHSTDYGRTISKAI